MTQTQTGKIDIQTISTENLEQDLQEGGELQFWNVLTDDYFNGEMIPGSRRVPLDKIGHEVHEAKLSKESKIVVYCAGPKCPQSAMSAQKLMDLGFTNVIAYEGGLEEWKNDGHSIESIAQSATV